MEFEHEKLLHCLDYEADCPTTCFMAKVTKDFRKHEDNYAGINTTWIDAGSFPTCRNQDGCPCKTCEKETCVNPLVCDEYTAWVCKG